MVGMQIAVRGYTPGQVHASPPRPDWRPHALLVVDFEAEVSLAQSLTFGSARLVRASWKGRVPRMWCVEETLIYADHLPERDPDGYAVLDAYCRTHAPAVDPNILDAPYRLVLRSRAEFVRQVLYPAVIDPAGLNAWLVAFGANFDLTRLIAPHLVASRTGWAAGPGYETEEGSKGEPGRRRARRRPSRFLGGFSLPLGEYEPRQGEWRERGLFQPRLGIKHLGTRKNFYGWIGANPDPNSERDEDDRSDARVLDLLTLCAAMTGESHSLESASSAFGFEYQEELDRLGVSFTKQGAPHGKITPGYVSYNRADVAATARLGEAVLAEYAALGIATAPTRIFSAASLTKDTLERLGVPAALLRQPDFDPGDLGHAMTALFGGRTEVHIRRTPVPVTVLDVVSQYSACGILLRLQEFWTCARVEVVNEDPARLQGWLARVTLDEVLNPASWAEMRGLALVEPHDDVLPVRADWHGNGTLGIGINVVARSDEPLWFAIPDLVASALRTGHAPKVVAVQRYEPRGKAAGLHPVELGAGVRIDLERDNLFRALIEHRARVKDDPELPIAERRRLDLGLKVIAASAYGITAEVRPAASLTDSPPTTVYGLESFLTDHREEPGRFFFAPQAALTAAGGRLMLMTIERLITNAGGSWAYADTDAASVVSTQDGGWVACRTADGRDRVRALSFAEVDELVREPFNRLNPYDRRWVPQLLKVEKVNFEGNDPGRNRRDLWAYAVAAKKYVLFVPRPRSGPEVVGWASAGELSEGEADIVDRREHGLGYLRNPLDPALEPDDRNWVTAAWAFVLAEEFGAHPSSPAWFDLPQMSRNDTLSTPRLVRRFANWNAGKPTVDAVTPFNFLNRVFVDHRWLPNHLRGLVLAAPYGDDPAEWLTTAYTAIEGRGGAYQITTEEVDPEVGDDGRGLIRVLSYGDLVRGLPLHAEPKSLGPNGAVCGPGTRGELSRRTVEVGDIIHIRKETTPMSPDGLEGAWPQVAIFEEATIQQPDDDLVRELLTLGFAELSRATGAHVSTVKRWKAGARPGKRYLPRLRRLVMLTDGP